MKRVRQFSVLISCHYAVSIIIPVVSLTFSASWQLCGPSIAEVHADHVRRIHGVAQVQAGRNSNVGDGKCLHGANVMLPCRHRANTAGAIKSH